MSFFDWFLDPVKNHYVDFEGRATRKQFWMFILVSLLISIGISIIESIINTMVLGTLFSLAILLPNIGIATRRLHDTNRSGWWQLLIFIPLIGLIVLIVWLAQKPKDEGNEYGSSAQGVAHAQASATTVASQQPMANPTASVTNETATEDTQN